MADFDSDTPASSTVLLNCLMSCSLFFFFALPSEEIDGDT